MTFETYIQGLFPITIPAATLASVMADRIITTGADITSVAIKDKELAYADVCIYFSKMPSGFTGVKDSDNGWSHSESSYSMTSSDKESYIKEANVIYKKYNDGGYRSSVKFTSLNGTPYYSC